MSLPKTQATAIASMLTAVFGDLPAVDESDERIRFEATVPATLSEATRLDLLTFLSQTANRFGHHLDSDGTSRIWAEVDHEKPPCPPAHTHPNAEPLPTVADTARASSQSPDDESEGQA